jgi:hypothetical protein
MGLPMIPNDLQLARLQLGAYEYDGTPFAWDWHAEPGGVDCGIKLVDDTAVVIFVGSRSPMTGGGVEDWERDFLALPFKPVAHPQLGIVHAGFYLGMEQAELAIWSWLTTNQDRWKRLFVIGHSLGAARARIFAALHFLSVGKKVDHLARFASPRVGMESFAAYGAPWLEVVYRTMDDHGHDYVTDLPPAPFIDDEAPKDVRVTPMPHDEWGLFAYHHMSLYAAGLSNVA